MSTQNDLHKGRGRFGGCQYIHDPNSGVAGATNELHKDAATVVEILPASLLAEKGLKEDVCAHIEWKWALRRYPIVPAIREVDTTPEALMITSEQPLGGTIHDMFRYTGCDRVDVDSGLPTYIVQHLLSMLEFCHSKQICIGAMHPQAIAARDTNKCDRMPALQFLGVCRWGLSTQKTARIRREQLNILHQKESEAAAMASMSPTASANVQGSSESAINKSTGRRSTSSRHMGGPRLPTDPGSSLFCVSPRLLANPDKSPKPSDDIYSVGCVLYNMLFGCHPFEMRQTETFDEWLDRIPSQKLIWPRKGVKSAGLHEVAQRMLAPEATRATIAELRIMPTMEDWSGVPDYKESSTTRKHMNVPGGSKEWLKFALQKVHAYIPSRQLFSQAPESFGHVSDTTYQATLASRIIGGSDVGSPERKSDIRSDIFESHSPAHRRAVRADSAANECMSTLGGSSDVSGTSDQKYAFRMQNWLPHPKLELAYDAEPSETTSASYYAGDSLTPRCGDKHAARNLADPSGRSDSRALATSQRNSFAPFGALDQMGDETPESSMHGSHDTQTLPGHYSSRREVEEEGRENELQRKSMQAYHAKLLNLEPPKRSATPRCSRSRHKNDLRTRSFRKIHNGRAVPVPAPDNSVSGRGMRRPDKSRAQLEAERSQFGRSHMPMHDSDLDRRDSLTLSLQRKLSEDVSGCYDTQNSRTFASKTITLDDLQAQRIRRQQYGTSRHHKTIHVPYMDSEEDEDDVIREVFERGGEKCGQLRKEHLSMLSSGFSGSAPTAASDELREIRGEIEQFSALAAGTMQSTSFATTAEAPSTVGKRAIGPSAEARSAVAATVNDTIAVVRSAAAEKSHALQDLPKSPVATSPTVAAAQAAATAVSRGATFREDVAAGATGVLAGFSAPSEDVTSSVAATNGSTEAFTHKLRAAASAAEKSKPPRQPETVRIAEIPQKHPEGGSDMGGSSTEGGSCSVMRSSTAEVEYYGPPRPQGHTSMLQKIEKYREDRAAYAEEARSGSGHCRRPSAPDSLTVPEEYVPPDFPEEDEHCVHDGHESRTKSGLHQSTSTRHSSDTAVVKKLPGREASARERDIDMHEEHEHLDGARFRPDTSMHAMHAVPYHDHFAPSTEVSSSFGTETIQSSAATESAHTLRMHGMHSQEESSMHTAHLKLRGDQSMHSRTIPGLHSMHGGTADTCDCMHMNTKSNIAGSGAAHPGATAHPECGQHSIARSTGLSKPPGGVKSVYPQPGSSESFEHSEDSDVYGTPVDHGTPRSPGKASSVSQCGISGSVSPSVSLVADSNRSHSPAQSDSRKGASLTFHPPTFSMLPDNRVTLQGSAGSPASQNMHDEHASGSVDQNRVSQAYLNKATNVPGSAYQGETSHITSLEEALRAVKDMNESNWTEGTDHTEATIAPRMGDIRSFNDSEGPFAPDEPSFDAALGISAVRNSEVDRQTLRTDERQHTVESNEGTARKGRSEMSRTVSIEEAAAFMSRRHEGDNMKYEGFFEDLSNLQAKANLNRKNSAPSLDSDSHGSRFLSYVMRGQGAQPTRRSEDEEQGKSGSREDLKANLNLNDAERALSAPTPVATFVPNEVPQRRHRRRISDRGDASSTLSPTREPDSPLSAQDSFEIDRLIDQSAVLASDKTERRMVARRRWRIAITTVRRNLRLDRVINTSPRRTRARSAPMAARLSVASKEPAISPPPVSVTADHADSEDLSPRTSDADSARPNSALRRKSPKAVRASTLRIQHADTAEELREKCRVTATSAQVDAAISAAGQAIRNRLGRMNSPRGQRERASSSPKAWRERGDNSPTEHTEVTAHSPRPRRESGSSSPHSRREGGSSSPHVRRETGVNSPRARRGGGPSSPYAQKDAPNEEEGAQDARNPEQGGMQRRVGGYDAPRPAVAHKRGVIGGGALSPSHAAVRDKIQQFERKSIDIPPPAPLKACPAAAQAYNNLERQFRVGTHASGMKRSHSGLGQESTTNTEHSPRQADDRRRLRQRAGPEKRHTVHAMHASDSLSSLDSFCSDLSDNDALRRDMQDHTRNLTLDSRGKRRVNADHASEPLNELRHTTVCFADSAALVKMREKGLKEGVKKTHLSLSPSVSSALGVHSNTPLTEAVRKQRSQHSTQQTTQTTQATHSTYDGNAEKLASIDTNSEHQSEKWKTPAPPVSPTRAGVGTGSPLGREGGTRGAQSELNRSSFGFGGAQPRVHVGCLAHTAQVQNSVVLDRRSSADTSRMSTESRTSRGTREEGSTRASSDVQETKAHPGSGSLRGGNRSPTASAAAMHGGNRSPSASAAMHGGSRSPSASAAMHGESGSPSASAAMHGGNRPPFASAAMQGPRGTGEEDDHMHAPKASYSSRHRVLPTAALRMPTGTGRRPPLPAHANMQAIHESHVLRSKRTDSMHEKHPQPNQQLSDKVHTSKTSKSDRQPSQPAAHPSKSSSTSSSKKVPEASRTIPNYYTLESIPELPSSLMTLASANNMSDAQLVALANVLNYMHTFIDVDLDPDANHIDRELKRINVDPKAAAALMRTAEFRRLLGGNTQSTQHSDSDSGGGHSHDLHACNARIDSSANSAAYDSAQRELTFALGISRGGSDTQDSHATQETQDEAEIRPADNEEGSGSRDNGEDTQTSLVFKPHVAPSAATDKTATLLYSDEKTVPDDGVRSSPAKKSAEIVPKWRDPPNMDLLLAQHTAMHLHSIPEHGVSKEDVCYPVNNGVKRQPSLTQRMTCFRSNACACVGAPNSIDMSPGRSGESQVALVRPSDSAGSDDESESSDSAASSEDDTYAETTWKESSTASTTSGTGFNMRRSVDRSSSAKTAGSGARAAVRRAMKSHSLGHGELTVSATYPDSPSGYLKPGGKGALKAISRVSAAVGGWVLGAFRVGKPRRGKDSKTSQYLLRGPDYPKLSSVVQQGSDRFGDTRLMGSFRSQNSGSSRAMNASASGRRSLSMHSAHASEDLDTQQLLQRSGDKNATVYVIASNDDLERSESPDSICVGTPGGARGARGAVLRNDDSSDDASGKKNAYVLNLPSGGSGEYIFPNRENPANTLGARASVY